MDYYAKYLEKPRLVREKFSVLDWANNRKVDMVFLEPFLLKIVESRQALP